jgi:hypothetical protein
MFCDAHEHELIFVYSGSVAYAPAAMETPRERAETFLHSQLHWLQIFERQQPPGSPEREGRVAASLGALAAAGLLTDDERRVWESRFQEPQRDPDGVSAEAQSRADVILEELLLAIPVGADQQRTELNRFEGAMHALAKVGISVDHWDARLRERLGWPTEEEEDAQMRELNAGGTQQDLVAVHAGPAAATIDGVRVLFALRFADGISLAIRRPPPAEHRWPFDASLRDDVGTEYHASGGGGGDGELRLSFRTAPPQHASWVELSGISAEPIRVAL